MTIKLKPFIIGILIPLAVGGLSALITRGNMDLYSTIKPPPLAPPAWLFPIVWTILYILMGISSTLIYTDRKASETDKKSALYTYALSLVFNFFWSIIFFNLRAFLFSFIWLLVLLFLIVRTITKYRKINKTAAYLQIPYLVWVIFAGYLNFAIYILNK
ncbi:MAG: TspO/MBR family protein [Acutalibacteraceae bacterium]|nr:TspO/MBR family protein [Acutalibacteraceae bacterium]